MVSRASGYRTWCGGPPGWLALLAVGLCGCQDRVLTITCDPRINTARHPDGEPLSVDIVSVFPKDLKGEKEGLNRLLKPVKGNTINARIWFERKPTPTSWQDPQNCPDRFCIPHNQIVSYTKEGRDATYGIKQGGEITGQDYAPGRGKRVLRPAEIPISSSLWHRDGVIYVFCKFIDRDGRIAESKPAIFHKVGDYPKDIAVRIHGKSIERITEREMGRDADGDGINVVD